MICKFCGQEVEDNSTFCQNCGANLSEKEPSEKDEFFTPEVDTSTSSEVIVEQAKPARPMKWFKFLIYFLLFASAVLNVISGLGQITGSVYADAAEGITAQMVYDVFPGLKPIDIFVGIMTIGLGVFAIVVRFFLAKYKKVAPTLLLFLYIASCAINVIYCIAVLLVVPDMFLTAISQMISSTIVSVIMIIVNKVYFDKRKELFIN